MLVCNKHLIKPHISAKQNSHHTGLQKSGVGGGAFYNRFHLVKKPILAIRPADGETV